MGFHFRGNTGNTRLYPQLPQTTVRHRQEAGDEASAVAPGPPTGLGRGPGFLWPELSERLGDVLASVTIEELCRRAALEAVPRAPLAGYEYQI